jgi:phage terminase large subunit-like protein
MKDYAGIATAYARDVAEGRILACKWVRLACERHLRDLARADAGWRYIWNPELETPQGKKYRPADRACHFIELLPHVSGEWAARKERIALGAWQIFYVASIFGWIDRDTKLRRYRFADLIVPRKNAKSTLAAGIGLYMFAVDGEFGAEVYSGATTEDQAYKVFGPAREMTRRTPEFAAKYGITIRESSLSIAESNSKFEPIIGKPGDGDSPSCAIVDEYHEHPTETLYDTMRTGTLARAQSLLIVITTAGDDVSSPCYAHQEDLQQILEGVIEDERRFGMIFTIDTDPDGKLEDWTTTQALIKANPNLGVSIKEEDILAAQHEAIRDARKQATFQTKHLDIWVASASPWLNLHDWRSLADKTLRIEDFVGLSSWDGVDLANVTDIASRCKCFKKEIDGEFHYFYFWTHYIPEQVIEEPENKHYQGWLREGWITATSGNMIDQDRIEKDILADAGRYATEEVAFDPWGAPGIIAALGNEGLTVLTVPLQAKFLSAPMKWIDGLVKSKRLHYNGDPVATWAVSNVTCKPDQNDNWFPRKPLARNKKTDPAMAMIIATARAMVKEPETKFQLMFV